jgi:tetratricopeptide (TPR) repeat protein
MARRKKKRRDETLVDIVEVGGQAQDFFDRYQKLIVGAVIFVALAVGGFFAYNYLYKMPRNQEAMDQMFQAQLQFERDSFALALVNPGGGYSGFLDIIDNYGGSKAANLASYYAGVSYLHLGQYEAAIDYLESFKPGGEVIPIMKFGALADAYSELGDFDRAKSLYRRAISSVENDILTPFYMKRLALLLEREGDQPEALRLFEQMKREYPSAPSSSDIDKFIARISG